MWCSWEGSKSLTWSDIALTLNKRTGKGNREMCCRQKEWHIQGRENNGLSLSWCQAEISNMKAGRLWEQNKTSLRKNLFCSLMQRLAGQPTCYTSRPRHHRRRVQQSDCRHSAEGSFQPKGLALASAENLRRWDRLAWVFTVALMKVPMLLNSQANPWEYLEAATLDAELYVWRDLALLQGCVIIFYSVTIGNF